MNSGFSKERSKRVNWSSGDKFCQVKRFILDDPPSQISRKAKDHLQNKVFLHSDEMRAVSLPSVLSKRHSSTSNQICIPQIRWQSPPMFALKSDWQVVAGEESEERRTQSYRETKVLEALYPHVSDIPRSPRCSLDLEVSDYDNTKTLNIQLIPIEEEDTIPTESTQSSESVELTVPTESTTTVNEKLHGLPTCLDADVNAAASAALTAILKSNEKGSLVDTDLLIKLLNEPKLIEALSKVSELNSKSCTVTSSQRATETAKPSPTCLKPYPDASSIGIAVGSESDLSRKGLPTSSCGVFGLTNAFSSSSDLFNRADRLLQYPRTLDPKSSYYSDTSSIPVKTMNHILDLSTRVLPASSSTIFGPDRLSLQNPRIFDLQSANLKPYSDTSSSSVSGKPLDIEKGLSRSSSIFGSDAYSSDFFIGPDRLSIPNAQLFYSDQPSLVSTTRADVGTHMCNGSLPSHPSVTMSVIKDDDYYKSLVRLHGIGRNETLEQNTAQYQVSALEMTAVPPKIWKPCKFFNSSAGCRNGPTCPYEHVSAPNPSIRQFLDSYRSKKLKISTKITE